MNAYTMMIVNDRIEQLRREAVERRMTAGQSPTIVRRVAAALTTLRTAITSPVSIVNPVIPRLDGYPYRG